MAASSSNDKVASGTGVPTTVLLDCNVAARTKPTKIPTAKAKKITLYGNCCSTPSGRSDSLRGTRSQEAEGTPDT